ncbi:hypothetical protein FIBSPDRAFT_872506 [Athelia psychrophila]|uniref:Integral membrane protein n=1 Tax=Athelia psychrophila TaxID=1759441 RepID=A0A165ZFN1_9AGAM|nr:hypothetical protein FIBSPDRAFT_872506 [Fibularhizoctonia sp. CBS 109695]
MTTAVPVVKPVSPLLAKYLLQLATHPLRTKSATAGVLQLLQEVLGSNFAGTPITRPPKNASTVSHVLAAARIDSKSIGMGAYGAFVAAPLSHYLMGILQKAFAGKTSPAAKIGMILANNLFIAPIQTATFLASMAVLNGAKSWAEVKKTIKAGFFSVIRVTWIASPVLMVVAQKFIPVELWVPFFNIVAFVLGTYMNAKVKLLRMAAAKKAERDLKDEAEKKSQTP